MVHLKKKRFPNGGEALQDNHEWQANAPGNGSAFTRFSRMARQFLEYKSIILKINLNFRPLNEFPLKQLLR